jgi:hypothetical protein
MLIQSKKIYLVLFYFHRVSNLELIHQFIIQIVHIISMSIILEKIKRELLSWPNVTAEYLQFGDIEFRINKREMGHIHGNRLADLPFPMKTRDDLVNSGRASSHHVMPQPGWVSYWIEKGEEDLDALIGLFRLRYERPKPKSGKAEGECRR